MAARPPTVAEKALLDRLARELERTGELGAGQEALVEALQGRGLTEESARAVATVLERGLQPRLEAARRTKRRAAVVKIAVGGSVAALAVAVSVASFLPALAGGTFTLFYGAVIWGLGLFFRGLVELGQTRGPRRAAGGAVPGRGSAAKPPGAQPRGVPGPSPAAGRLGPATHFAIAALLVVTVGVGLLEVKPWLEARQRAANEALAIADLRELGAVEAGFAFSQNRGGFVPPESLAGRAAFPGQRPTLHPRFAVDARNGYLFRFEGRGPATSVASLQPAFESFVYSAVPLIPGRTGARSFSWSSQEQQVRVHPGTGAPGAGDPFLGAVP